MSMSLNQEFTPLKLLRFAAPSIIMMMFMSLYTIIDGMFVSRFVGSNALSATNIVYPVVNIMIAIATMMATGGNAIISKYLGEGKKEKANQLFSMLVLVSVLCGVGLAVLGLSFLRPIASALGAQGQMLEDSVAYGRIILIAIPAFILQYEFQCLFATAQKPKLGLYVTVAAGLTNVVLDAVFVAVFSWGVEGAAAATALSQGVGGILPLLYFGRANSSLLKLTKLKFDGKALLKTCTNGSSELMSNISASIVSMLYNMQLLTYAGEDGVAAYGVLMYVNLVFQAVFLGYSVGTAPVISYHDGAKNHVELKGLFRKSLAILTVCAVAMFASALLLAQPLSVLFVGYDPELLAITLRAFSIYSFSFLFSGFAVFGSSFFTALNDGLVSAFISFLRILVFQVILVLIFPLIWQLDGIWLSIVAAEMLAVLVTAGFIIQKRKKYHYA